MLRHAPGAASRNRRRAADAIERIAVDRIVTPAVLGRARDGTLDYQTAKWVWHCMARFGLERENAD
ncbi:hypothetical protein LGN07_00200 [Burkholderia cepacia]|uniref:hypothetical protein n=1 Tax=Burkholderia cepacia TaxID=292 RepID=UPI00075904FC|nr:hypothetical protein [Burkholderia cepacia]KVS34959.1 hypothetical protein WK36_16405 [Burkholderia cepacia]MCA8117119.1 hypothetical protein [Burkholderia cepacia]